LTVKRITSDEARELYLFIKNHPNELDDCGVSIAGIKNAVKKVLGSYGNGDIRNWLVEIKFL
jgi:hypothetical protein